jgi:acyl carrier protein
MTITQQVIALITDELRLNEGAVQLTMNLKEDLDVQSLDAVEMLMALEDKFNIVFDEKDHERVTTVQDVVDLVASLVK